MKIDLIQHPTCLNLELRRLCGEALLFGLGSAQHIRIGFFQHGGRGPLLDTVSRYSNQALCAGAEMNAIGPTATYRHVCDTSAVRGRADSMCSLRAFPA